ncbi:hypothetical protein [Xylella fastidiosa]|uniref:hypothetical protein n=1 Tax=Xylella fastidiosa TaxID=2371 RepID=UPI003984AC13
MARSWRTYLSSLTQSDAATQLQRQIDQLRAAIPTESPNGSNSALNAQLLATGSVDVTGTLSSGFVTLSLEEILASQRLLLITAPMPQERKAGTPFRWFQ